MVLVVVAVLAVVMIGPLLLERLERHVPPPGRASRPTVEGEEA
jgi:hypothetical protein